MKKELLVSALKKLSRRGYHSLEMRALFKEESPDELDELIFKLRDMGYLDDEAWEESFVQKAVRKKWGKLQLLAKLKEKAVPPHSILKKVASYEDEMIQSLIERRLKRESPEKIKQFLYRKGFSLEKISNLLKVSSSHQDEWFGIS